MAEDWIQFDNDAGGGGLMSEWDNSTDAWLAGGTWEDTSNLGAADSLGAEAAAGLLGDSGGGGNWLQTILGGLGSLFGGGAGGSGAGGGGGGGGGNWLGQLLSALGGAGATTIGGLVNADRGADAASQAGQQQSQALNRGIDLQTAQWLQQQQNLAPYLQAGQGGVQQLQQLASREQPGLPGQTASIDPRAYGMPDATPLWQPQNYTGPQAPNATDFTWNPQAGPRAQDFTWTPQQGPRAQDFRYTPGQTTDATRYASQAPQLFQGAMPGTQVPTLSGQQLLEQDPGAAFRQTEARRQLEASAAARGGLLSGGTLQALQSRSQDLASQEYQNAWQRMMARDVEQYGRNWNQYQQQWNQGVQGTELGLRTQGQNFQQDLAAAQLREQVNQVAMQQGWTQAQAEAVFREQVAQQASQQGWTQAQAEAAFREQQNQLASQQNWSQALAGQQNQFTQGLQSSQWNQQQQQLASDQIYQRNMEQRGLILAQDVARNQTDYERQQTQFRQQLAQFLLPWEQASTLANLGGQATGISGQQGQSAMNAISNLLGQQGTAQAGSTLGSALAQNQGTTTAANSVSSVLSGLNA